MADQNQFLNSLSHLSVVEKMREKLLERERERMVGRLGF